MHNPHKSLTKIQYAENSICAEVFSLPLKWKYRQTGGKHLKVCYATDFILWNKFHFISIPFWQSTFFNHNYVENAKSIKISFTQVFTPDGDSSQVGKIPKPQIPERRRISQIAKKMPCTKSQGGSSHWNHHKSCHWSHSCSQGLATHFPSTPPWVKLYWYKTAQFQPSRKPGPTNEPSVQHKPWWWHVAQKAICLWYIIFHCSNALVLQITYFVNINGFLFSSWSCIGSFR